MLRDVEPNYTGYFFNTVDGLNARLKDNAEAHSEVLSMLAVRARNKQNFGNGFLCLPRIFGLLATVTNLVTVADRDTRLKKIVEAIRDVIDTVDYPIPGENDWDLDDETSSDNADEIDFINDERADSTQLATALIVWLDKWQGVLIKNSPISAHATWRRYESTAAAITSPGKAKHLKTRYTGALLHRLVVAFLHANLVQACIDADINPGPRMMGGTITSDRNFIELFKYVAKERWEPVLDDEKSTDVSDTEKPMNFILFVMSCPLWGFLLEHDNDDLQRFAGSDDSAKIAISSITTVSLAYLWSAEKFGIGKGELINLLAGHYRSGPGNPDVKVYGLFDVLNTLPIVGQKTNVTAHKQSSPRNGSGTKATTVEDKTVG